MQLVSKVRNCMKGLIHANKKLTTSRVVDVFDQISFNYNLNSMNYNNQRQAGNFSIQYLISPKPESGNTVPSITYDQIISTFEQERGQAFIDAGLILISYSYEQSDIVTDPISGSVSLAFTINIQVAEKIT